MKRRRHPEHDLQRAVVQLAEAYRLRPVHVPNGRDAGGPHKGAIWKALGVRSGIPDLLFFRATCAGDVGLALELKIGKARPTASQIEWHDRLREQGWRVEVVRSIDAARAIIEECYR